MRHDERTKLFIIAHIPPSLERDFLQHVRNFDSMHPGCHFEMGLDAPEMPFSEMIEKIRVNPALTFTEIIERKK